MPNVWADLTAFDGMNLFNNFANCVRIDWADNGYTVKWDYKSVQSRAFAIGLDASLASKIYKPAHATGRRKYGLSAAQFEDVVVKSIAVSRYLKIF